MDSYFGRTFAYQGAWSGRPTASAVPGAVIAITGLPAAGKYTYWYSDGTRWVAMGPQMVGQKTGITSGAVQTGDQIIGQLGPFPAGLFDVGTEFKVRFSLGRNDTANAYGSATNIRMGTAGTVADASIASVNLASIFVAGSGNLSFGIENESRVATATSIQKLGTANATSSFAGVNGSGAALNTAATVSSTTANALYVSISTTMAAATTTTPQTGYMDLWVMS